MLASVLAAAHNQLHLYSHLFDVLLSNTSRKRPMFFLWLCERPRCIHHCQKVQTAHAWSGFQKGQAASHVASLSYIQKYSMVSLCLRMFLLLITNLYSPTLLFVYQKLQDELFMIFRVSKSISQATHILSPALFRNSESACSYISLRDQVRTNSSIIAHLTALYLLHPARPPHSIYVKMSKDKMDVCSSLSQRVSLRPCMFCLLLCSNVLTFPPCLSRFLFERSRSRVYALSAPLSKSVLSNLLCSKHSSVLLMILLGLSKSARVFAPALSEPLNRTMFYLLLCSNNPTSSLCLSRFLSKTSSSANMARLRHRVKLYSAFSHVKIF